MLTSTHAGGVATLTLARPDRGNALGPDLVEALLAAVLAAGEDDTVHTLVLRGEGRHFCTGLDLSDLDQCRDGDLLQRLVRIETLLAAVWQAPMRTVALAQGRTWGAGADLFAACEVRLAMADATFRFPGAQFGIVLGTRRLAERVGADAARAMTTTGGEWRAADAQAAGLVQQEVGDAAGIDDALDAACRTPAVDRLTAAALRAASRIERADQRDADLAALVRSAARPGLVDRIRAYRARLRA
ncbi:enoyl-CoA hydratase/isomerase family protein [Rubrivivax albus]|uniref:Enoyl-CoA hydratase/isomerase family protein n=1 Tax=Rubrivivax albus TaxID=2499835 RepID=A0A437JX74_9BURK|nr:enoyl-CoA hydratase/isomerase family protein [Rubrivivax albus]RVT52274.1 enoyl-CoA hydratase/isomerase family protein [Rubrivivax albus]